MYFLLPPLKFPIRELVRIDSRKDLSLQYSKEEFEALYRERMALYQGLADTVIDTDKLNPEQVARKILCK